MLVEEWYALSNLRSSHISIVQRSYGEWFSSYYGFPNKIVERLSEECSSLEQLFRSCLLCAARYWRIVLILYVLMDLLWPNQWSINTIRCSSFHSAVRWTLGRYRNWYLPNRYVSEWSKQDRNNTKWDYRCFAL